MRLIDADALLPMIKYATTDSEIGVFPIKIGFNAIEKVIDDAPTVDAVPSTDVDELKMRLIGAEAAVNGMREQINRMVIINSEKVPVVRCKDCKHFKELHNGIGVCERNKKTNRDYYHDVCGMLNNYWYCADGERKDDAHE